MKRLAVLFVIVLSVLTFGGMTYATPLDLTSFETLGDDSGIDRVVVGSNVVTFTETLPLLPQ